jgi:Protein of unknown function (DUF1592)/Protein of unknown function (DUF1588)/Protein of unknown function (DUF1587)/Protein of unknown function (DUF1585)/Protein of unknown function (DUF1595)/Ca-dependent carbohydrate-binding module xylan-binding/Cytochrome C oxidase, cbb3-type, subunit III
MRRFPGVSRVGWLALSLTVLVLVRLQADEPALKPVPEGQPHADFVKDVQPLLKKYCAECHFGEQVKGGIAFDTFKDERTAVDRRQDWEKIARQLASETMPPVGKPEPTDAERQLLVQWIDSRVLKIDCSKVDPGRVTVRRLNRTEYNNTIRDLLGVEVKPADDFPSDDVGYGFDHIGDVLSLPPVLFERYLTAAEKVVDVAILTPDPDRAPVKTGAGKTLASVGDADLEWEFPRSADYKLRVKCHADQAGPELAKMMLKLDGTEIKTIEVAAVASQPETYEIQLNVPAGKHKFSVRFLNDYYQPNAPDPKDRGDRNLIVHQLEIQGPLGALPDPLPASHTRLITCRPANGTDPTACARTILRSFVTRAFRRPATDGEVDRLTRLVAAAIAEGDSFERGIQVAVTAVLVSPQFLFRIEADAEPNNPQAVYPISDFELASRLSYFLWSSMPDDELFRLAQEGALRKSGNLAVQVRRMLKDPKAAALTENFAMQWLQLRNLKLSSPDLKQFPEFNEALRTAMETETRLFFETIVREDRNLFELLDANFTFVNERLAKHYGLPGIQGEEFQRVSLTSPERGGLLGQASILTVTSNPTRTSPVKRGKWILETLFNAPPPPPPPNVPELKEAEGKLEGTLRQRMEQHRANPACASCHTQMDALGFGLENFDPVGQWRTKDGGQEVDASGELPGGVAFKTPAELKSILKGREAEFRRCLAEKLMVYALGRGLEYYDKCTVDVIVRNLAANHDRFSVLVLEIVNSDPFQKRRGKQGNEP